MSFGDWVLKLALPILGTGLFAYFFFFLRTIYITKRRNQVDEINFVGKQIHFNNDNKPLTDVVDELNKSMGSGSNTKKE